MKKIELFNRQNDVMSQRASPVFTYIPAEAKGLVNSSTRCPGSKPSPSTEMTVKSSAEMVAPGVEGLEGIIDEP